MDHTTSEGSSRVAGTFQGTAVPGAPASLAGRCAAPGRVLVPLNGWLQAEAVVPLPLDAAGRLPIEVVLLRVLERVPRHADESPAGERPLEDEDDQASVEGLAGVAATLSDAGVRTWIMTRWGSRPSEIAAAARELGAEVIVMTTRRRTAEGGAASVAEAVQRHAPSPVFPMRQRDTDVKQRALSGALR
jgi:nucleotide-binding universal stress UspA family protein